MHAAVVVVNLAWYLSVLQAGTQANATQQSSILPVAHMLRYCLCFASLLPTVAETRCKARHHLIRVPLLEPAAISCPQIGSAACAAIIEHGEQGSPIDRADRHKRM